MISQPDDGIICEGAGAVFTCVLNSNIKSDDVQWYRFIKDTSTTVMVDPNEENFNIMNHSNESTINSSLNITNAIKSYAGYFWVGTPSLNVCNVSLIVTSMYVNRGAKRSRVVVTLKCIYVAMYIHVWLEMINNFDDGFYLKIHT